ncbi:MULTISPECIES: serine protease [Planktothricoides]|uniref:Tetratricopeptide repeat protein n=2 Tax=Planktothricoides raciborskii TaxID=132608 RepID=A0AAU8JCP9_9CYAN|nr:MULTISPECIES: serine protease [Planktothricoides]MBD2542408.1 tetratricopeptide repeat protein [Planktothricoides raciborskii FACHB-1370]MBD2582076.1 tetratricopeptide repeat protein [Planktothricoides raciborskii FACHB-1261]
MMQFATPVALAADVQQIAREITVRIDGPGAGGSGFIVKREGNTYTVATNWHVVDREGQYTVKTEDGREYSVSQIQQLPGADLAVMYFTSPQSYRVAELGNSDNVSLTQPIYVSGWMNPLSDAIRQPAYSLIQGQITAIQSQNDGGYTLVYNTTGNYKGMSGGPVLNQDGKVIGVNGQAISDPRIGVVGLYLGIPINTFERLQARVSRPNLQPRETTQPSNTQSDRAFLEQGNEQYNRQDYESAIASYNQAIRINPELALAYNNRGAAYADQGKLDQAIADYNQAIRINPEDADAYNNRGAAYADQGKLDQAIADFNQAIRINPNYADAYHNRSVAYEKQGKLDQAIADYNQAIRINPEDADAYNNRGLAYYRQGKLDRAIADFNEAIRINSEYAEAYNNRGLAYYRQGKLPEYASAYYNRGLAYSDQGKLDQAIADYNQAIRINPELALAYNNRGLAYSDQGKLDQAIADFNQAIRINPEYADAYRNRGFAYYNQGNNRQAQENFRKASELYQR